MKKAEDADSAPLDDGLSIPEEVQRRHERKAQLAKARAEIEARARARAASEREDYERKVAARDTARAAGKRPRGKEPAPPSETPAAKEQYNFTDPESRIMPVGGGGFEQSYNAQAAVEIESRLIVGQHVSDAANDKQQLEPGVRAIEPAAGPVGEVLIDSGFVSEAARPPTDLPIPFRRLGRARRRDARRRQRERRARARRRGARAARTQRARFGKEKRPARAAARSIVERAHGLARAHRRRTRALQTPPANRRARLRHHPFGGLRAFGKSALGFRAFRLRGKAGAALEWTLITLAYNLRRLHRLGAKLKAA